MQFKIARVYEGPFVGGVNREAEDARNILWKTCSWEGYSPLLRVLLYTLMRMLVEIGEQGG